MNDSRRYQSGIFFFALLCTFLLLVSCTSKPKEPKDVRRYPIDGKVVAVDKAKKEITLQHREIPGYMPAMTMPFPVQDDGFLTSRGRETSCTHACGSARPGLSH